MPTGYTNAILQGADFPKFAWGCARAFGALVMMRDDSADAPIPEKFLPSDYHSKRIEEAKAEIATLKTTTDEEATAKALSDYEDRVKSTEDAIRKCEANEAKYRAVLREVQSWEPPTPDHTGMKKFMVEQIEQSIDFDCNTRYWRNMKIVRLSGATWKRERLAKLEKDLKYHKAENIKEISRTNERNAWIEALRKSIPMPVVAA